MNSVLVEIDLEFSDSSASVSLVKGGITHDEFIVFAKWPD